MQDSYQPVFSLINEIKGTTRILSTLLSRKAGVLFILAVIGIVVSKVLLG